ncbi:MAG: T9SS type A sorting domain-containing protein [Paludibacter sp.]
MKLFPNPVKDQLYAEECVSRLEILNLQGVLLLSSVGNTITMAGLPQGMYMVRVSKNGNTYTSKVLKD